MSESIQCWQCGTRMTLDELASNDGDCPRCEVEVHLAEYLCTALSRVAELEAELSRLRVGQEPVAYQCREIGEGDWADCDKKWFDYCERSPLHDTRKLYTTPQPSAVPDGRRLVPVEPTPEMVSAAEEAHMPFGDMDIALRMAILAAPSAPKADDPVKQMLLEALEELMYAQTDKEEALATAAIAAARQEGKV